MGIEKIFRYSRTAVLRAAGGLRRKAISVHPRNDVVSSVDSSRGVTIQLNCIRSGASKVAGCHYISESICELLTHCGDQGRNLRFKPAAMMNQCYNYKWERPNGSEYVPALE